jgi:tetratricopeptide (TPR) repeat protein/tRNA A-37 threonylcarbamoyl transferase component Bud32
MPENRDDDILADLLVRWEELHDQGRDASAEELCRDCPHLASELARRIEALKVTSWLDKPVEVTNVRAEPQPPAPRQPRLLAGRYRLDELIAEGGFAQVWKGYDQELQRAVAVKVPKSGRLGSVEAFIAEARRVAKIKHPGIVPIFDTAGCAVQAGQAGGTCFLVSEYVEGGSLADRMRGGPVLPAVAAWFVAEIAEALHYAHRQGFVHRDIKPGNILLDHHGRALLTDFGIAVAADEAAAPALGTLRYMSPEQVEGKPVDARSDLYGLGVVLHELLTGKLPYSSTEPNALRQQIIAGTQPATAIPAQLRAVCRKLLERSPAARYASAGELAADLRRFLASGGQASGRWKVFVAGTVALLLAGVGLAVWLQNRAGTPPDTKDDTQPAKTARTEKPATVEEALALGKKKFDKNYFEAAEEAYTEAIRLDPTCAEAYKRRGACKFNEGRVKDSLPDFGKALELDPDDAEAYRLRALAYANLQDFSPAITDLERVLKLGPADPAPCHDLLARVYSNRAAEKARAQQFAEAAADVTEAMKHDPKAAVFYHQRGSCYFNLKEYEKAAADFTEASKREPTKASHYRNRGHCLQALGREDEARADFEKAKSLEK